MIKICIECNMEYRVTGRRRNATSKYCSRNCKAIHQKKESGATRICPICKQEFYVKGNPSGRGKYCSRKCFHLSRVSGKIVPCKQCGKETYKSKVHLKNSKNYFCCFDCGAKYSGRNKVEYKCDFCKKSLLVSKSRRRYSGIYCSLNCRNEDPAFRKKNIKANADQQWKTGLNKLELAGREILLKTGINFEEQVLMFNKFLVDALIPDKKIIIQWDGIYWHSKEKRKKLDKSQDAYLNKCGYRVLRFSDNDIYKKGEEVYENIQRAIQ